MGGVGRGCPVQARTREGAGSGKMAINIIERGRNKFLNRNGRKEGRDISLGIHPSGSMLQPVGGEGNGPRSKVAMGNHRETDA